MSVIFDSILNKIRSGGVPSSALSGAISANTEKINVTTDPYTIASTKEIVQLFVKSNGSGGVDINLPAISTTNIVLLYIKDALALSSTNNITINVNASDTIVDVATGQTSTVLASNGGSLTFSNNGANEWYLI